MVPAVDLPGGRGRRLDEVDDGPGASGGGFMVIEIALGLLLERHLKELVLVAIARHSDEDRSERAFSVKFA